MWENYVDIQALLQIQLPRDRVYDKKNQGFKVYLEGCQDLQGKYKKRSHKIMWLKKLKNEGENGEWVQKPVSKRKTRK